MMPKQDACGMGNSDIQRICPVFHCSPVLRDPRGAWSFSRAESQKEISAMSRRPREVDCLGMTTYR